MELQRRLVIKQNGIVPNFALTKGISSAQAVWIRQSKPTKVLTQFCLQQLSISVDSRPLNFAPHPVLLVTTTDDFFFHHQRVCTAFSLDTYAAL